MIDTIQIRVSSKHFNQEQMLRTFNEKLTMERTTLYKNGFQGYSTHATFENWKFWLSGSKLTASGSLSKLYNGSNLENSTFTEVVCGLNKLQDLLGISLEEAYIPRIDVGYNFKMDHPVSNYFELLVKPHGYKEFRVGDETREYRSSKGNLMFYDKVKEIGSKTKLPEGYDNYNLLRYEVKFNKKLLEMNGLCDLRFTDLFNQEVYYKLISGWMKNYLSIPKIVNTTLSEINFTTLTSFKDSLCSLAISEFGGLAIIKDSLSKPNIKASTRRLIKNYLMTVEQIQPLNPKLLTEFNSKIQWAFEEEMYLLSNAN